VGDVAEVYEQRGKREKDERKKRKRKEEGGEGVARKRNGECCLSVFDAYTHSTRCREA
jgi:hypothetical protein